MNEGSPPTAVEIAYQAGKEFAAVDQSGRAGGIVSRKLIAPCLASGEEVIRDGDAAEIEADQVAGANPQPNPFQAVATKREEGASAVIWKPNERGPSANWRKELQSGFGMELLPGGQFEANARYFAIGVLAYHLAPVLKRRVLPAAYRAVAQSRFSGRIRRSLTVPYCAILPRSFRKLLEIHHV